MQSNKRTCLLIIQISTMTIIKYERMKGNEAVRYRVHQTVLASL